MQPGCRCSNRTGPIGITRLVSLSICWIMPIDVRGKWHFTALIEQNLNRFRISAVRRKLNNPATTGGIFRHHRHPDGGSINRELITGPHSLGWTGQTQPLPFTTGLKHQQLGQPASSTPNLEPCLQHTGVIDHQKITAMKFLQQVPDIPMTNRFKRRV